MNDVKRVDVIVIGAGFGGLGAALTAAERGARVTVLEALSYGGGCASTFSRRGYRFDAGATLCAGLGPGQLFAGWIARYGLPVQLRPLSPAVELRAPGWQLEMPPDRAGLVDALVAQGCPRAPLQRFFAEQRRVADALWPALDAPGRLPPFDLAGLGWALKSGLKLLPALRWAGRPLRAVLEATGCLGLRPLRLLLDALCQITVQVNALDAEAPLALSALDYLWRGAAHVDGGLGALATALAGAVEQAGGELRWAARARGLRAVDGGWEVLARGQRLWAPTVLANVLPQDLAGLLGPAAPAGLAALAAPVAEGWGAVMRYCGLQDHGGLPRGAHHYELIGDPDAPFVEGNHIFASLSAADEADRAPPGQRALTVSTHLAVGRLRGLEPAAQAQLVQGVQERMDALLCRLAPEVGGAVKLSMPASPRTFRRFTGRAEGLVGGVPRRAGLQHYRGLLPRPAAPGLWLVGDSVFPGQSTLATAIGGARTARAALGGGWGARLLVG